MPGQKKMQPPVWLNDLAFNTEKATDEELLGELQTQTRHKNRPDDKTGAGAGYGNRHTGTNSGLQRCEHIDRTHAGIFLDEAQYNQGQNPPKG